MGKGLLGDLVAGPEIARLALEVTKLQRMKADYDNCHESELESLRQTRMLSIQHVIDYQKPYFPWLRRPEPLQLLKR